MVNPIIANLIKNSIKNSIKNTTQTGGSNNSNDNGNGKEKYVIIFLVFLIVITVIPFAVIENAIQSKFNKDDPNDLKDFKEVTETAYYITIAVYSVIMILSIIIFKMGKNHGLKILFAISLLFMIPLIIGSYIAKLQKSDTILLFSEYIGVKGYTSKQIGFGMMTNIFFGFIDNFGLFFGMDAIDKYLKGSLDELTLGGIGNTYSDFIGAFVGNAVGDLTLTLANVDKTPIISEIVGIVIGCILGLVSGKGIKKLQSQK